jgi:hypothetical protein
MGWVLYIVILCGVTATVGASVFKVMGDDFRRLQLDFAVSTTTKQLCGQIAQNLMQDDRSKDSGRL